MSTVLYTLVTGGSQGIGRALAEVCAQRGMPLLIVALPNEHLEATAHNLRQQYQVPVHTLGVDLSQPESTQQVMSWLSDHQYTVHQLINNAGFGRGGYFEQTPLEEYRTMVRLNNECTVALTHALMPSLKAHRGRILNLSSMEGPIPLPYKAVYTGTKHFIYGFSLALREELRAFDVSVTVLCPGPTLTNEDGLKRIKAMGAGAKLMVMLPEQMAPSAIKAWLDGQAVIVPGALPKATLALMYYVPRPLRMRLLERMFRNFTG